MPPLNKIQQSLIAVSVVHGLVASAVQAATIQVDAGCSLREAIRTANIDTPAVNTCEDGSGADVIEIGAAGPISFPTTTYSYNSTDSMLPSITSEITISSTVGGTTLERPAANPTDFRVITVEPGGNLTLESISVKNGVAAQGGGIYVYGGELTLTNTTVSGNSATAEGGGIALLNYSELSMTSSSVTLNNSDLSHGGIYAYRPPSFSLTNSTVSNNTSVNRSGGIGIVGSGSLITINGGQISNNTSGVEGGGLYIYDADVNFTSVTISNNEAKYGAGIYANDAIVSIDGSTFDANVATDTGGGLQIKSQSIFTVMNTQMTNNVADSGGGAICLSDSSLSLQASSISQSTVSGASGSGGAILAADDAYLAELTIENSTLNGNSAHTGAAIASTVNTLIIDNSTLFANSASYLAAGIHHVSSPMTLRNSTISGNTAPSGTALYLGLSASKIYNSTIFNNSASAALPVGAAVRALAGTLIYNTVVAESNGANCYFPAGHITNNGSWFDDDTCDGTAAGNPQLNPLGDNNEGLPSSTLTHSPGLASPLLGAAITAFCTDSELLNFQVDQRGAARGVSECTIGSVEGGVSGEFDINCFVVKTSGGQVVNFCL